MEVEPDIGCHGTGEAAPPFLEGHSEGAARAAGEEGPVGALVLDPPLEVHVHRATAPQVHKSLVGSSWAAADGARHMHGYTALAGAGCSGGGTRLCSVVVPHPE